MKKRTTILAISLLTGALVASACVEHIDGADDDDGAGNSGTGAGGGTTGPTGNLSEAHLTELTTFLASDEMNGREEGTPESASARQYIIEQLQKCNVEPAVNGSFEQPVTTGSGVNILGMIPGTDSALADRTVMLSAHYDHIGHCGGAICNGANDNAAAVAIVLGVACELVEHPTARSVMIASWDAEEPPTFLTSAMGSQFYADNPVVPLENTDVVLVLELVGADLWPGYGGHFLLGAELSPQVTAAMVNTTVPDGLLALHGGLHLAEEQPVGHQPWSDYDAFRNKGTPVVMASNGQNKDYHQSTDELATVNLPKMALEAEYMFNIVTTLGNAVDTPVFDAMGTNYGNDAATSRSVLEAALASGGIVDALSLSAASRTSLEGDLAAAIAIGDKIAGGGAPNTAEIRQLRDGVQRIMCLAGSTYGEALCRAF